MYDVGSFEREYDVGCTLFYYALEETYGCLLAFVLHKRQPDISVMVSCNSILRFW